MVLLTVPASNLFIGCAGLGGLSVFLSGCGWVGVLFVVDCWVVFFFFFFFFFCVLFGLFCWLFVCLLLGLFFLGGGFGFLCGFVAICLVFCWFFCVVFLKFFMVLWKEERKCLI